MMPNDMDTPLVNSHADLHERDLAARQQRSQVVSTVESEVDIATLFYDPIVDQVFLKIVSKTLDVTYQFETQMREKNGRVLLMIGNFEGGGGFQAVGHGALKNTELRIKTPTGRYSFDVDSNVPCWTSLKRQMSVKKSANLAPQYRAHVTSETGSRDGLPAQGPRKRARQHQVNRAEGMGWIEPADEASGDLTELDLKRLRGEIAIKDKYTRNSRR